MLDETTILNFRHLLEAHELCGQMLDAVNQYLAGKGRRIPACLPWVSLMQTIFSSVIVIGS